jgi:lantibiotic modifying enzyme
MKEWDSDLFRRTRFLEDAITTEAFFRNRLRSEAAGFPWLADVEDAEVADLFAEDIPYFVSRVGEHSVSGTNGATTLTLHGNPWEECCTRIHETGQADLDRQSWLIRVAMTDLTAPPKSAARPVRTPLSCDPRSEDLIATAVRIGDRICDLAILENDRATWLVPKIINKERLVTRVAGIELYDGLPGIALFLGYLSTFTVEKRYERIARAAVSEASSCTKPVKTMRLCLEHSRA